MRTVLRIRFLIPTGFLLLLVFACSLLYLYRYQPLHLIPPKSVPFFTDDFDRNSLILAAERQQRYLLRQPPEKTVQFGQKAISCRWLLVSMTELLDKLRQSPDIWEFNEFLRKNYTIFQAGGRKRPGPPTMLVTGYYEPLFAGSLIGKPPFVYPIYSTPPSLMVRKNGDGISSIGRYDRVNNFVPFWSREQIENQNLLRGHELAYLADPFDAYLLHVQGSGKILLPDGSLRTVRFAGSNGLEYNSIGKLLVDEGIMDLEDVDIEAIRQYLAQNPEQQKRILHHNPRFIFFGWGNSENPVGSNGIELTPGRSVAVDQNLLPAGTFAFLSSSRPLIDVNGKIIGWTGLNRFVFPQDSGAAIKGTGRVDLFWGSGPQAGAAAGTMKHRGKLYFFVKKGF
ncbi:murein transglycosylase A [Desulforhopalus singaporensis]|uniref:peptidoglycan lytic exotransglycosylase n=1 Tax=Desulforhopalus singaporensis TaxID=91360 RepID=A0A1H0NBH4_9BACT|nr:MltA domain-containing protein [Desulforhopalus singaporensis]SDO89775.1 membrane-bound lytic murein transglycosylase A [Desulforhopalus singaporensis]